MLGERHMKKLLITGASGFLGWNVCRHAKNNWQVFGTVFSNPVEIPGCKQISIDLTNFRDLKRAFNNIKPDAVIHTAAEAQPDPCEQNPEKTDRINIIATEHIAVLCADASIPFVFTSTDLVFDGEHPPYTESDPVSPILRYGEQKVYAEERIQTLFPAAAICRMPLMYGDPSPSSPGSLHPILTSLQNKKSINLFTDQIRTPLCTNSAAKGLLHAINNFQGIIHLGGNNIISRYEFGIKVANYCGLDKSPLLPVQQKETDLPVPRPIDVSLDSSLAFSMGFEPLTIEEEFKQIVCMNR